MKFVKIFCAKALLLSAFLFPFFLASQEVEARISCFQFRDKTVRSIYGEGAFYAIEVSSRPFSDFLGWINLGVFPRSSSSSSLDDSNLIWSSLGFGLKYRPVFKDQIAPYLGAGFLPSYIYVDNHSPSLLGTTKKFGLGGVFKAGVCFFLPHSIFLDFFVDYILLRIDGNDLISPLSYRRDAVLDGINVGGSLGYWF